MREPIKTLHTLAAPQSDHPLPKARQLYLNLYQSIETGQLPFGAQLPPSRQLAEQLGIGRNTVTQVYEQLASEGLVRAEGRRGTCVIRQGLVSHSKAVHWSTSDRSQSLHSSTTHHRALAPGEPDTSLFPSTLWRRALAVASRLNHDDLGYTPQAQPSLQQAIARYLATYRSVKVSPEQIIITASTRQSLLLAAQLYADPGDIAWAECPGYLGVIDAFRQSGLDVKACSLDTQGLVPRPWSEAPRLIYLTPCFQYPRGMPLGPTRRDELLEYSSSKQCVLFEDDYDSEFRDDSQPRPALYSESSSARVLHAGTFSKLLFPAVRVAWLIVPGDHVHQANRCLRAIGGGNNTIAQSAVTELMQSGAVARHLQRARHVYGQRRLTLLRELRKSRHVDSHLELSGSLNLVIPLRQSVSLDKLVQHMDSANIGAHPLEHYEWNKERPRRCRAIVVGLGSVDSISLPNAVARLNKAISQAA